MLSVLIVDGITTNLTTKTGPLKVDISTTEHFPKMIHIQNQDVKIHWNPFLKVENSCYFVDLYCEFFLCGLFFLWILFLLRVFIFSPLNLQWRMQQVKVKKSSSQFVLQFSLLNKLCSS